MGSKDRAECKEPAGGASAQKQGCITISAIMMGTDMAIVRRILTSMGGLKGNLFSFR